MEEKTEMDRGMGQIPPSKHPEILKSAYKYRIDENDPTWILVNLVTESLGGIEKITSEGVKALREASVAVTAATSAEVTAAREQARLNIQKMQEAAKANIASALSSTLETEIRKAVSRLQSQSNRPLHKKWLVAMLIAGILAVGAGAWGSYSIHKKWVAEGWEKGVDDGINLANPTVKSFQDLIDCAGPGWKVQWSTDGKKAYCYPFPDPKNGKPYGWRIR